MLHRDCQECISLFLLLVLLSREREILFGEGTAFCLAWRCVVALGSDNTNITLKFDNSYFAFTGWFVI